MLQPSTVKFLRDLSKHNSKTWFDNNREKYDAAKSDFETFIQELIDKHGRKDETIRDLVAKKCTFRINRDIRFSKDKTPYKTNMGASLDRGGKKSIYAGYYIHLEPGGKSFVGGGLWMPMPEETKKVRQEIDYCLDEFRSIFESKKFKAIYGGLYTGDDASLKKIPHGFEADNPAAPYIKLKSWLAMKPLTDVEMTSADLTKKVLAAFETLQPFIYFINRALG
ncbi:DUF2461 domain-containing protein [Flavitalea sp.]|nr:DUF2461 domain-containing protein [Flavitalea sp.]